jgi:hypothetical protein
VGRTALYRDPVPWKPARAELQLEADAMLLQMPDGRMRRHSLDGFAATAIDGCVAARTSAARIERRFVRMLVIERGTERHVVITPPDQGAVAPNVVRVPEAPAEAAIVDAAVWEALAEWLLSGGSLSACSLADLARLAAIATPQFAVLIGEVAAQRALELAWVAAGPLRGSADLESSLQPLADAARASPRAAEALISALAHAAGARRRRRAR